MADQIRDELAEVISKVRNSAFDVAIEICRDLAHVGCDAEHCAIAIRFFQTSLDARLSESQMRLSDTPERLQ